MIINIIDNNNSKYKSSVNYQAEVGGNELDIQTITRIDIRNSAELKKKTTRSKTQSIRQHHLSKLKTPIHKKNHKFSRTQS